ncbi:MORN_motif [Hexamita inflata]|uniref:MORN motif n=1 Tax=Hexamita inflata TaxID=28002 RepID=A0AA86N9G6_9EUKA|nr:MORN motif [Hexamita inflata]
MGGDSSSLTTIVTPTYTFTGEVRSNQMSGFGTQHFSDGTVYVGEFEEDKFHGNGSFWDGKETFQGDFKDGKLKVTGNIQKEAVEQFNKMLETHLLKQKEIEKYFEVIGKNDRIEGKLNKKQEIQVNMLQAKECKQTILKQSEYIDPEIFKYIQQLEKQRDDTANKYKQLYEQMTNDQDWYQESIKKLCQKCEMQQNQLKDKIPVKDQKVYDKITKIDDDCKNSEAISTQSKNNSIIKRADENIPHGECSVFFPNGNVLTGNLAGHTITNPVISFKNGDCVVITAEMKIKNHILEILNQYDSLKLNQLSNDQKQFVKVQPENLIINGSTKIYYPNGNVLTGTLQGNSFENVLLTFKNKETVLICQEVRIKNETVFKVINNQFFDQRINFKDDEIPRMQIGLVKTQQKCMISYFNGSSVQGQYSNGLIYDLLIFFKNGDKARLNECIQVNSAVLQALNQKTQYQMTDFDNQTNSKVQVCDTQFLNEHSKYNNSCSVLYSNGNTLIGQLENGTLSNTILKFENDDVVKILEPITIKSSAAFKLLQSANFDSGLLEEFELNRVSQIEIKSDVHSDVQPQSNTQPSSANVILNMKSVKNLTSKATEQPKEETKTENGEQNINQGNDQKPEKINSDQNAQNQTKEQTKQNLTGEQENCCKTEIENKENSKSEQNPVQMQDDEEKVIKDEKQQQKAPENQQMDQNNCQKAVNEYNDAHKDESQVTTTKSEQTLSCARNNATNAIQSQEQSAETGKQQVPIQNTPLKETDSNLNTQPKHCVQEPQVKQECVNVSDKCTITYSGNSVQGQINGNTIQDLQIIFKNGDKAKLKDVIYISAAVLNILNQKDKFNKSDFSKDINNKVQICNKQFSPVDNCSVLYPNGNILSGQLENIENGILINPILKFKNDDAVEILDSITIKCTCLFKLLQQESYDSRLLYEFEHKKVFEIKIKGDTSTNQCDHRVDCQIAAQKSKPEQDNQDSQQQATIQQKAAHNSNQCEKQAKELEINQISNQPQTGDTKTAIQSQQIYLPALIPNALQKQKDTQDECQTQNDLNNDKQEDQNNQNEILKTDEQNIQSAQEKLEEKQTEEEKVQINKTAENGQSKETQMNVKMEPVKDLKEEKESINEQKGTKVQQQVHEGKLTKQLKEEDESSSSIQIDVSSSDE